MRKILTALLAVGLAAGVWYYSRASPFPELTSPNPGGGGVTISSPSLRRLRSLYLARRPQPYASPEGNVTIDDVLLGIDEEIVTREEDIEAAAEALYTLLGCGDSPSRDMDERFRSHQDTIYQGAIEFAGRIAPDRASHELGLMRQDPLPLLEVKDGVFYTQPVPQDPSSLLDILVRARHAERCLGSYGQGAFAMYRDFLEAMKEGDCETAEMLTYELYDAERWLYVQHSCIPASTLVAYDLSSMMIPFLDRQERFFDIIPDLSLGELTLSAGVINEDEYREWLDACSSNHATLSQAIPFTYCVATLSGARRGKEGTVSPLLLGLTVDDVSELIRNLPSLNGNTHCYLEMFLGRARFYDRNMPSFGVSADCFGEH